MLEELSWEGTKLAAPKQVPWGPYTFGRSFVLWVPVPKHLARTGPWERAGAVAQKPLCQARGLSRLVSWGRLWERAGWYLSSSSPLALEMVPVGEPGLGLGAWGQGSGLRAQGHSLCIDSGSSLKFP